MGLYSLATSAQSIYINPSVGAYINSDIKKPYNLIGYGIEVGYCFPNTICAGINYGTLDLTNKLPFMQARTAYTVFDRKGFGFSIQGGLGYVFNLNQLIGEGDICANIHLKSNFDFNITFANQGIFKIGYQPAINIGFTKNFYIKRKKQAQ